MLNENDNASRNLKVFHSKIIHIDMDCFYAAVEVRDRPDLVGKPVAVGGRSESRGVLSTANYEARKFGVRSAMPTRTAFKLCPHLNLVPHRFEVYREESHRIRNIFKKFTDLIEPLSLDEAYLDVTNCSDFDGSATLIAQEIRRQIFLETKLTASAGIAPNKLLAKVASDWKKPNGQFVVAPKDVGAFIQALPVSKINGVGKVTTEKMKKMGIETCLDLQRLTMGELNLYFGKWGRSLYNYCRGVDSRKVKSSRERKSLSVEHTYSNDISGFKKCSEKIEQLFHELVLRLEKKNIGPEDIRGYQIKVKFNDFTSTTVANHQGRLDLNCFLDLLKNAMRRSDRPIRLLGVGVGLFSSGSSGPQLSLLDGIA